MTSQYCIFLLYLSGGIDWSLVRTLGDAILHGVFQFCDVINLRNLWISCSFLANYAFRCNRVVVNGDGMVGIKIMQNGPSKIKIIWLLQTFCFCIFISKFVTFTILVSNERPLLAFLVVLTSIDTYRHKFLLHTFGHDLNLVWLTTVCVWKMFLFHQGIRRIH
jgi:hypothetical protein